ncbi:MAG TPA: trypsin-like peptidase domain-containing protein [Pyrinomonadaceae bacterium]|nr:trypsin-like peptidase domain-containing protein [Pyrinomonadaceae bacterium]
MFETAEKSNSGQQILRHLRRYILGLAVACTFTGAGLGFMLSGRTTTAEPSINPAIAPETLSASFASIAKQVEPAVVNIDTKTNAPEIAVKTPPKTDKEKNGGSGDEDNPILEYFRRQLPSRPSYAVGSGFIVDKSGYILTNYHVIEDATRISVRLPTGEEFIAEIVGTDVETDLAVLKVNAGKDLPAVKLGDSDAAQVGDWVLAIGSPFGLDQSVTAGIISQVGRQTPYASSFQKFIQTDAAINRGNSGGPLVNMRGEVVGVNSQIATVTGDYNGVGFALPSKEAAYVYQQILQNGKVRRGYLGVELDSIKPEFAKVYEIPETKGSIITNVRDTQGGAAKAGLQENDVIVEFGGQKVSGAQDLISKVASTTPGQTVDVIYLREINNKLERRTTNITLGERPKSTSERRSQPKVERSADKYSPQLGLVVTELTPQLTTTNKFSGFKGLLVKDVNPNGLIADVKQPGRDTGIIPGDLITRVNRVPVTTQAEFTAVVGKLKTGDPVVLHFARYDAESRRVLTRIVQFTFQ